MPISLNAEQKSIESIFANRYLYNIPAYQRAYSWGISECERLFEDLENAFINEQENGYFLGSLILGSPYDKSNEFEIIDGQQRLTTLTIFLRVLTEFDKDNVKLKEAIWLLDDRSRAKICSRLKLSDILEKDKESLSKILDEKYDISQKPSDKKNNFYNNANFFYEKLKEFQKTYAKSQYNLENFIDYILRQVTLLPIYTMGKDSADAREKALRVFETTNNRGMPLDDSDIFKSRLYYMANRQGTTEDFNEKWNEFEERCDYIDDNTDNKLKLRVFRIYSYLIRGENGIKSSEIGLRDFFEKDKKSPFKNSSYQEILNNLNEILNAIELFDKIKSNPKSKLAKWFQLIDLYSNMYPKDTMILYLKYKNITEDIIGKDKEQAHIAFAKRLVKRCYAKGATTTIKHDMYAIMVDIAHNKELQDAEYKNLYFDYLGLLYKGYAFLAIYLDDKQELIYPCKTISIKSLGAKPKDDSYNYIGNHIASNLNIKDIKNGKKSKEIKNILLKDLLGNENKINKERYEIYIKEIMRRYKIFFGTQE